MNHEFDDDCPCGECKRIWDETVAACIKRANCLRIVDIGPRDAYYRRKEDFIGLLITNVSLVSWLSEEWECGDVRIENGNARIESGSLWYLHQVRTEPA